MASDEREVRAMADPQVVEAVRESPKQRHPNLVAALVVAVIGVVGEILLNVLPGDGWMQSNYDLYVSLTVIVRALIILGAVWLGALLAYWQIVNSRR
jgi:hypothetical protein